MSNQSQSESSADELVLLQWGLKETGLVSFIGEKIKSFYFTNPHHRLIWGSLQEIEEGSDTSVLSLYNLYLARITTTNGSAVPLTYGEFVGLANNSTYALELTESALRAVVDRFTEDAKRRIMVLISDRIKSMTQNGSSVAQITDYLNASLEKLHLEHSASYRPDWLSYSEISQEQVARYEALRDGLSSGISTPFVSLNNALTWGGFIASDFVIMAAHTSFGKTQCALSLAEHAASHHGAVMVFSLEMNHDRLFRRSHARLGKVPLSAIRPHMEQGVFDALLATFDRVADLPVYVNDTAATLLEISRIAKRFVAFERKAGRNPAMIVVDYLQLLRMGVGAFDTGNENQRIVETSRALKLLANQLGVPVVAVSQFSRDSYKHERTPNLADLYGGAIEKDADYVIFLHGEKPSPKQYIRPLELILAKARDGALVEAKLLFDTRFGSFTEVSEEDWNLAKTQANPSPIVRKANSTSEPEEEFELFKF